jgi:hypothetical protein
MGRRQTILVCTVVAIVGFGVGAASTFWLCSTMANVGILTRAEAELAVNLGILEKLHVGESADVQKLTEIQLDGTLITLDALAADGRSFSLKTYERLNRLRELRDQAGYAPPDQDVADAVGRALRLQSPAVKSPNKTMEPTR